MADARYASGGTPAHVRARRLSFVVWAIWGISAAVSVVALPIFVLSWASPTHPWPTTVVYAVLTPLFVGLQAIGALVVTRAGAKPIGWIFFALGLIGSAFGFCVAYATYALLAAPGVLPGGQMVAWLSSWMTDPALYLVGVFLPLLFPTGRPASARWRAIAWLAPAGALMLALFSAVRPGPLRVIPMVINPFGAEGTTWQAIRLLGGSGLFLLLVLTAAAAVSLILRLRRAEGVERQQLRLFVATSVLFAIGLAGVVVLGILLRLPNAFARLPLELGVAGIPIAAAIALFKYRLYKLEVWINRGLVYASLTVTVVAVYVVVVETAGALFRSQDNLAISLTATCVVALLLEPVRQRLQHAVNRLMYGDRDEPYRVLSRLGHRLEATLAPEAVLPTIVETVATALKLPYTAISLKYEGETRVVTAWGVDTGDTLALPLVYQQEPVGLLILGRRSPGEAFGPADGRLLGDLARQAGVAAHAVKLTAELQRTRERLVIAREEERRRLRRDLHDGLGPRLAGLTLKVEAARNRLHREPLVESMLTEIATQTQDAIADIRRLVYALRPPALDELGLVSALREGANDYSLQGAEALEIVVTSPEKLPLLPAAVEVAAYRIAQEALTNVVRHASARHCFVRLEFDKPGRVLRLEIQDDGCGLGSDWGQGVGLSSMRERAAELGGTCLIEADPTDGTIVRALLPCGAGHEDELLVDESVVVPPEEVPA